MSWIECVVMVGSLAWVGYPALPPPPTRPPLGTARPAEPPLPGPAILNRIHRQLYDEVPFDRVVTFRGEVRQASGGREVELRADQIG